jgi:1-deoxy-D-xylulose-5-phosphate synthase
MIKTMAEYNKGPISVRYPEGEGLGVKIDNQLKQIEIGKSEILEQGKDLVIIALGTMVNESIKAKEKLNKIGIFPTIINARFAKPIDKKTILLEAKKTKKVITVEENSLIGGFGEEVAKIIRESKISVKLIKIGIPDKFINQGEVSILRKITKCDSNNIFKEAVKLVRSDLNG